MSLSALFLNGSSPMKKNVITIEETDIKAVISKQTGIPLNKMEGEELERMLNMEKELEGTIIGQDEAVRAISKALRRSRADLKDPQSSNRFIRVPRSDRCR